MRRKSSKSTGRMSSDIPTCEQSEQNLSESISSAVDSPARTSATPESVPASTESAPVYGPNTLGSFAFYDRVSSSWRTWQLCLDGDSEEWSATWPVSGMTRNGIAFRRVPSVPRIFGRGFSLLPTPRAADASRGPDYGGTENHEGGGNLLGAVKMLPTPTARDWRSGKASEATHGRNSRPLNEVVCREELFPTPKASAANYGRPRENDRGDLQAFVLESFPTPTANRWDGLQSHGVNVVSGQLNPTWVEWLMGFPLGWTDLEDSETPSCHKSPNGSADE